MEAPTPDYYELVSESTHMGLDMGVAVGVSLINILLLIFFIAGFVMFVIVLFKLNKALTIWLGQNGKSKNDGPF